MSDDGPDLSCFDFGDDEEEEETREEKLKRHKQEALQLRAEAKEKKQAIPKSEKEARKAADAEYAAALEEMEARHARELGGGDDSGVGAAQESVAALSVSEGKQSKQAKRKQKKEQEEREREQRIAAEKAGAGPSERDIEMGRLVEQLKPLGLRVADIQADGHCLFRAVAHQLQHHGADVAEDFADCRRLAASYMRSHPADFEPFIAADGSTVSAYTQRVEGSNDWGGQLEITALAHACKRTIAVFSATAPLLVTGEEYADEGPRLELTYHKHYYGLGEHYNAVVAA